VVVAVTATTITCPGFSIQEQQLRRNVKRFWRGLVFKAHRLLYHSTLGSRVIKKKKKYRVSRFGLGRDLSG
jgi:hypothetical protein